MPKLLGFDFEKSKSSRNEEVQQLQGSVQSGPSVHHYGRSPGKNDALDKAARQAEARGQATKSTAMRDANALHPVDGVYTVNAPRPKPQEVTHDEQYARNRDSVALEVVSYAGKGDFDKAAEMNTKLVNMIGAERGAKQPDGAGGEAYKLNTDRHDRGDMSMAYHSMVEAFGQDKMSEYLQTLGGPHAHGEGSVFSEYRNALEQRDRENPGWNNPENVTGPFDKAEKALQAQEQASASRAKGDAAIEAALQKADSVSSPQNQAQSSYEMD